MTTLGGGMFRLSRIYAEGWKAANGLASSELDVLNLGDLKTMNPYSLEAERSRWAYGFNQAFTTARTIKYSKARK